MMILNHERVSRGPVRDWLYMLHGIFGAGRNWGTVARRVAEARPEWGVVLVDLREHGGSQGFAPPHTVATAAHDLVGLAEAVGMTPRAVLGHSFGGKVALHYAADAPEGLEQVWVIDSTPEAGPPAGSAWRMLGVIERLPDRFATRNELIEALERERFSRPVAQWMATNLVASENGYQWRFDRAAVSALIQDFFRQDEWPVVEGPLGAEVRFVRATESSVLSVGAVRRIRAAAATGRVRLDTLEGGHWLNADNPDGMVDLLVRGLPLA